MAISQVKIGDNLHDVVAGGITYCTCATAAATAAKVATVVSGNFNLFTGARIIVKFTNANSVASPTLTIQDSSGTALTDAKTIYRYGTTKPSTSATSNSWSAGAMQAFTYDGTSWIQDYWYNSTYSNVALGHGYAVCETAASTVAKTASLSSYALSAGGRVSVMFKNGITIASPTLNINSKGAKAIYYHGAALTDTSLIGPNDIVTFVYSSQYHIISIDKVKRTYTLTGDVTGTLEQDPEKNTWSMTTDIAASGVTAGTYVGADQVPPYKGSFNIPSLTIAADGRVTGATTKKVTLPSTPTATKDTAGITIVYPAENCTTFDSDSGTCTPLAVQKAAKKFAITRPSSSTTNAITRYSNTTGDVKDSKITIEDVTNTKDTSKTANVLVIPAEGEKKMVYGYCTDQTDGTSFIGGVFPNSATSYPYNAGLAIGGTSGNLLWKGQKVVDVSSTDNIAANAASANKVKTTLANTTKAYILGTSTTPTSTATAVSTLSDSGVYLTTTSGELYAGGGFVSGSTAYKNGYIELSGATPYIDFHFGSSTADYTSRIIESTSGILTITGGLTTGGALTSTGAFTASSTSTLKGAVTANSTMSVTGALTASSTSTLKGAVDAQSTVKIGGGCTLTYNSTNKCLTFSF